MHYEHAQHGMKFFTGLLVLLTLSACGGAAVPHDQLSAAKASVRAAEVGGAQDVPKASLHVKKAQDQINEANKLIEEGENEKAAWALQRAAIDADLALAYARETALQAEAAKAVADVEALKKRIK